MIPKADILDLAKQQELFPTTVEKDYVLGWLLFALAQHASLGLWIFKGGTCLKKCFFETYRFSEDLDFTVPPDWPLTASDVRSSLLDLAGWVEREVGIQFPPDGIEVERYLNTRGKESFQAKMTYIGPLNPPRQSRPRIKFDLTQDELVADETELRRVFHPFQDSPEPAPRVRCYSVNEILAEKTRALYEREGRARDVYDLVHFGRSFRAGIDAVLAADVLRQKFVYKGLPEPTVATILARVDYEVLKANWDHQLAHQLPTLPPVDGFFDELRDAIAWWLQPALASKTMPPLPLGKDEKLVPRRPFSAGVDQVSNRIRSRATLLRFQALANDRFGPLEKIRYAARNRLCVEVVYHGVVCLVEPYSLRLSGPGNTLLYVYELKRGGTSSHGIKAFKIGEIASASSTKIPFTPRYDVEL
ncbi:MAG: nucleotidyl transferase AbiEii/AbiGii toxin family protein [Deltaproteobacteria bacterium]|nr:nucleotidyl transferase AbiEii/AbiGii toxin family protein [Deltaproteobacteria bacterium]